MQDNALLTQYAHGSEAAFSQLLARHLPLVYRTCRRELASEAQAEDAAQVVFLLLARKAKTLRAGPSLAGWLCQTAVFVAKDVRKQEARRRRREEAVMQEAIHAQTAPTPNWDSVEPLLNSALSALKPADREAILLRFLEGRTLAETGALLGVTEDAARMRCARALEKLRRYLTSHGTAVTGLALTGFLTAEAAHPVPAHAAEAISQGTLQAILSSPTTNVLLLSKGVSHTMKLAKIKAVSVAAAVLIAGASVPLLVHALSLHQALRQDVPTAPIPVLRQQAFQVGMIQHECDLRASEYVYSVFAISSLSQPVEVNAETIYWSRETPRMRGVQASRYGQVFVTLRQMQAPPDVSQWYLKAAASLSQPLPVSQVATAQAAAQYSATPAYSATLNDGYSPATKKDLTTDLAGLAEMKTVSAEATAQKIKVDAWLEKLGSDTTWDARLGAYAADLHNKAALPNRFPTSELTNPASSLLKTAPATTPDTVREALTSLASGFKDAPANSPVGFVTLVPGNAAVQQINQAYDNLSNIYDAARTGQ